MPERESKSKRFCLFSDSNNWENFNKPQHARRNLKNLGDISNLETFLKKIKNNLSHSSRIVIHACVNVISRTIIKVEL